jgi:hypothetical protein
MCSVSFALGRWRGEQGKPLAVALNVFICPESYEAGHEHGAAQRASRTNRNKSRRGVR